MVVVPLRSTIDLEDVESVIPIYHVRMKNFNSLEEAVEEFEKNYISAAIGSGKTLKELSILLDISESTVKRKLRKYNLRMKDRVRSEL